MKLVDLSNPIALATIIANSNANSIPVNATGTAYASQAEGFPHITMIPEDNGGEAPHGLDFNGFLKMLSSHVFNIQNGSPETFNPAVSALIGGYPKNAQLWLIDDNNSRLLKSTKDDNTDNFLTTPSVIGTSWVDAFPTKDYVDNNFVTLSTAQTITGEKTFTKEITEKVNMTKGTAPAASMYPKPYKINDSADSMVGNIQFTYGQNMSAGLGMLVYNCNDTTDSTPAALQVFNVNGTKYATCPTPTEDTTGSIQIDTVGARNTKLGNYVTLGTEQTITGNKTFTAAITFDSYIRFMNNAQSYRHIYSDNSAITKGTAPSANTGYDYLFRDSANSNIVGFGGWYNTNGNIYAALYAYNPTAGSTTHADLKVGNYASGRADVVFETPTGVANSCLDGETNSTTSNMLALKGWVNNPATATNVVHRTGNETIGGTKTFTGNPAIQNTAPALYLNSMDIIKGTAPSETQYAGITFRDSTGDIKGSLARILTGYQTNKESFISLYAFKSDATPATEAGLIGDSVTMHYPATGNPYATAPASDVVNSIVTTINKSKAANGYFQLGNGLIVQWGTAGDINGYNTITFPKAFTSTNYRVVATQLGSNADLPSMSAVSVTGKTKTTFKVGRRAITEAATVSSIEWIAVGY